MSETNSTNTNATDPSNQSVVDAAHTILLSASEGLNLNIKLTCGLKAWGPNVAAQEEQADAAEAVEEDVNTMLGSTQISSLAQAKTLTLIFSTARSTVESKYPTYAVKWSEGTNQEFNETLSGIFNALTGRS